MHWNFTPRVLLIASIFSGLVLQGCENSPDVTPGLSSNLFLGGQSSFRNYEITTWQFESETDNPFVKVPESLFGSISIDSALAAQGVVTQTASSERLIAYDISWNVVSNPSLYPTALQMKETTEFYDLNTNLSYLSKNKVYSKSKGESLGGSLYVENSKSFNIIFDDDNKLLLLSKPLAKDAFWIRTQHQYTNDEGVMELFQEECRVIGLEEVEVKAGKFLAYKIEVMNHWVSLESKRLNSYEYYVPEVGLVLEESDTNVAQMSVDLSGNTTLVNFRRKFRKELVSYHFEK